MGDDISDGGLIDLSGLCLAEALTEADQSALAKALNRVLVSSADSICNGFSASIGGSSYDAYSKRASPRP
jgi:hypothetical protein